MMAAENDVIPGAKVGGIGDVVRDIPSALASLGSAVGEVRVSVMIPAYGALHLLPGANRVAVFTVEFRARTERIELYEIFANRDPGVRYLLLHHPLFGAGGSGNVYCDDDSGQPFATDANKFALFSLAGVSAIAQELLGKVDVIHLHDWHSALAAALIRFDDKFDQLRALPCVYSIHNLALQGIRPFAQNASSLEAWFPHLHYDPAILADPRWPHCVNPMAAAIRLASRVHTVSPSYAREILAPNDDSLGFHGGEGLEADLQTASEQGRLIGIINGINYTKKPETKLGWPAFMQHMASELLNRIARAPQLEAVDYVAHQRLLQWQQRKRPAHVITSVGRLTEQKVALLLHPLPDGQVALEHILSLLSGRGIFILLGTGDQQLELQCTKIAAAHPHFIFVKQYSERLSTLLFSHGDLFLMPSSFEPCGISQMLAMRQGQPCLAHAVGGLIDTIRDDIDGFLFSGESMDAKCTALIKRFDDILNMRENRPTKFSALSDVASKQRFDWQDSAGRYLQELYQ